jgi:malate dehydrogenase
VIAEVAVGIRANCPDALRICITNPLGCDGLGDEAVGAAGEPRGRHGGILDSSRFRLFPAQEFGVRWRTSPRSCWWARRHDGAADALPTVAGIPVPDPVKMAGRRRRRSTRSWHARDGGGEIVKLLERGSAFYAPAASAVAMAESFLLDKKRVLPRRC